MVAGPAGQRRCPPRRSRRPSMPGIDEERVDAPARAARPGTSGRAVDPPAAASASPSATVRQAPPPGSSLRSPPTITGAVHRGEVLLAAARPGPGRSAGSVARCEPATSEPGARAPSTRANAAPRRCRPGRQRDTAGTRSRAPGPAGWSAAGCPATAAHRRRPPGRTSSASAAHRCRQRNRRGASCTITTSGREPADQRRPARRGRRAGRARCTTAAPAAGTPADVARSVVRRSDPTGQVGGADHARRCCPVSAGRHLGHRQPAALGQLRRDRRVGSGRSAGRRRRSRRRRPPAPAGRGSAPGRPGRCPSQWPICANAVAGRPGRRSWAAAVTIGPVIASTSPPASSSRRGGPVRLLPGAGPGEPDQGVAAGVLLEAAEPAAAAGVPVRHRRACGPARRRCRARRAPARRRARCRRRSRCRR